MGADVSMETAQLVPEGAPALLITYELQRPAKDFDRHQSEIRAYLTETWGDAVRHVCGARTWIVPLGEPPQTVHAHLTDPARGLFDEADQLLVMDLNGPDFAPREGTEALPWLPDWLRHDKPARLVVHHRRQPPIYRYLDSRDDVVSPTAATWLVPTRQSAAELFDELTAPRGDDPAVVSPADTLLVTASESVEHQRVDLPAQQPYLLVSYRRHRPRPGLAALLAQKDDWWHNMDHAWIVSDPRPAADLRAELEPAIADVDCLLVVDFWSPDNSFRPPLR